jgi:hypothetical protein
MRRKRMGAPSHARREETLEEPRKEGGGGDVHTSDEKALGGERRDTGGERQGKRWFSGL